MDESRTQATEGGMDMAEVHEEDRRPAPAPGELRTGLVLDDDGHLPRRQVGRVGVSAETRHTN